LDVTDLNKASPPPQPVMHFYSGPPKQFLSGVDNGTFNDIATYGLNALNGTWDGSHWTGNFLTPMGSKQSLQGAINTINKALAETNSDEDWEQINGGPMLPNITIMNNDGRAIMGMRVIAEFEINGQPHSDYEDIGSFDQHYGLVLNGMNGTLGSNGWWEGNFLRTQYHGFDTQIDPHLLTFLNVFFIICMAANAVAAVAGAAGEIRRGFDGGGPGGGGWSLGQQI